MSRTIICDNCQAVYHEDPHPWILVERRHKRRAFCSWRCLARYSKRIAKAEAKADETVVVR